MADGAVRAALDGRTDGLPGRAEFHARLASLCDAGEQIGLLLVDIDMLRSVNETLGREVGDEFIAAVASRLARLVEGDGFVARIDGDEFALVQPGMEDANVLRGWAAEVRVVVREPLDGGGAQVVLTASVGAALGPADALTGWELIRCADVAQFVAKSTGRDRAIPYKASLRTQIETRVRDCVALGNFSLNYQPMVTVAEPRALVGVESFLRWRHPTRGLLFPGDFRPVLEDRAAALMLGDFVIGDAIRQMRRWLDDKINFGRVSINLAAAQLRSGDVATTLLDRLAASRVPATHLMIELPEDVYLDSDLARLAIGLNRLREAGVRIAVDGFAGSAASFEDLLRLPINALKLDRAYLHDPRAEDRLAELLTTAPAHGITVIAEGVETSAQLLRLTALGCREGQGYHIARPMAAAKLPDFLRRLGHDDRLVA